VRKLGTMETNKHRELGKNQNRENRTKTDIELHVIIRLVF